MSTALRPAVLCLILATSSALAGTGILSPYGYGQIRFGMKIKSAEAALKQRTTAPDDKAGCGYVQFKKYPELRFMVEA